MDIRPDHRVGGRHRHIAVGAQLDHDPADGAGPLAPPHRRAAGLFSRWPALAALFTYTARRHRPRDASGPAYVADPGQDALYVREHFVGVERAGVAADGTTGVASPAVATGSERLAALIAPLCGLRTPLLLVRLIEHYGSASAVLRARRVTLARILPDEPALVDLLVAVRPLLRTMLKVEMFAAPILPDDAAVIGYLKISMAHETAEHVRMLYLDAKNRLIAAEVVTRGSVTSAGIFPREIVRRAIELGATGLIMAHNHPSGDPAPSHSDLTATRAVADAARLFDIILHDHIIIGRGGHRSLRADGYL